MAVTSFDFFGRFLKDESGAVTVDWVVLTAATVGLGIALIATVSSGTNSLGLKVQTALTDMDIGDAVEAAVFAAKTQLGPFFGEGGYFEGEIEDHVAGLIASEDYQTVASEASAYLDYAENGNGPGTSSGGDWVDRAGIHIEGLSAAGQNVDALASRYNEVYAACASNPSCSG